MPMCPSDEERLKDYLRKALKALHREHERASDNESALCAEAALSELELLWEAMFQEDPPTAKQLTKKKKEKLN